MNLIGDLDVGRVLLQGGFNLRGRQLHDGGPVLGMVVRVLLDGRFLLLPLCGVILRFQLCKQLHWGRDSIIDLLLLESAVP